MRGLEPWGGPAPGLDATATATAGDFTGCLPRHGHLTRETGEPDTRVLSLLVNLGCNELFAQGGLSPQRPPRRLKIRPGERPPAAEEEAGAWVSA